MKAIELTNGHLAINTKANMPSPGSDEALIRVTTAGICGTDLELVKGYAGFNGILGHEFVGTVEQANDPNWQGKRVVCAINIGCGLCKLCLTSGPEHCPTRQVIGIRQHQGAFADYISVPMKNLYAVPDDITDEQAVFTEPLAAAANTLEQIQHCQVKRVAVIGAGRLGLLIIQLLNLHYPDITVIVRSEKRAKWLLDKFNITATTNTEGLIDQFDAVVEASGNPKGLATALTITKARGHIVLKSTFSANSNTVDLSLIVIKELNIHGSRCGDFSQALTLLTTGKIKTDEMISHRFPLEQGIDAFKIASELSGEKVLLTNK